MSLAWLTVNPARLSGCEGGDKAGPQLVGFKQATTVNALKIGKNTQ